MAKGNADVFRRFPRRAFESWFDRSLPRFGRVKGQANRHSHRRRRAQGAGHGQDHEETERDHHVHRGAGQRHPQLLARVVRHTFEPGHSADGQEHDVPGTDTETPGGEGMPVLVKNHAAEDEQHRAS